MDFLSLTKLKTVLSPTCFIPAVSFQALHSVEDAASLQRVSFNGQDVLFLVLSRVVANLGEFGTIQLDPKSISSGGGGDPLKQSALLVTNAILSGKTQGLDMKAAARCWRSLRHLSAVILSLITKSGYVSLQANCLSALDKSAYSCLVVSLFPQIRCLGTFRLP